MVHCELQCNFGGLELSILKFTKASLLKCHSSRAMTSRRAEAQADERALPTHATPSLFTITRLHVHTATTSPTLCSPVYGHLPLIKECTRNTYYCNKHYITSFSTLTLREYSWQARAMCRRCNSNDLAVLFL